VTKELLVTQSENWIDASGPPRGKVARAKRYANQYSRHYNESEGITRGYIAEGIPYDAGQEQGTHNSCRNAGPSQAQAFTFIAAISTTFPWIGIW